MPRSHPGKDVPIATAEARARSPYAQGLIDAIPLAVPGVPFGFILGLAVVNAPIDGIIGWWGGWFLFAGAAQLTMITLLAEDATAVAAVAAALVVNARHFMYSMAVAEPFQRQPRWFRWLGPYALIDQVFAMVDHRRHEDPTTYRHYYLGVASTMLLPWMLWTALGIWIGAAIPVEWNLAFAVPVLFVGLMVLGIRSKPGIVAASTAFVVTVVLSGLPNRTGMLIGALAGVIVAAFMPIEEAA